MNDQAEPGGLKEGSNRTVQEADVVFLTEYFHPEEASTAQLMTDLTTELAEPFSISVVTALPSYHAEDRDADVPRRTTHRDVDIERVRATRFDKDRSIGRVLNWVSFTLLACVQLLTDHRSADVLVTLSNPPILPFAAAVLKRLCGTSYVYLVHDIYPDMAVGLGYIRSGGYIHRLWRRLASWIYWDADRIVVLGDSMRARIEDQMEDDPRFDATKIEVVHNWEDGEQIKPVAKTDNEFAKEHGTIDRFTIVYSGNIGRFHELETAIDAIGILEDRGHEDVELLIIGEGAQKEDLQVRVQNASIDGVRFLPFQPINTLPKSLTCGDVSLVGIKSEVAGMCVSSKLYSSLAAGMPILAIVDENDEVARVVGSNDCGYQIAPGNPKRAADAIERWKESSDLVSRQGDHARSLFETEYQMTEAVHAYERILADVALST